MTDREKLIELMTDLYGGDPLHYGVKAYHIADHLIAHGVTVQQWVSVEDELPKTKKVINGEVYYRNVAVLTEDKVIPEKIAYYDEGIGLWFQPLDIFPLRNVTHWMPLPEPPKEEITIDEFDNYCPNCGADMREG